MTRFSRQTRIARVTGIFTALAAAALLTPARAQTTEPVVRIEEDWVVEVGVPDATNDAPQIINVLSPVGDLSLGHVVFELNHKTFPDYSAGGMQLQRWFDDAIAAYGNYPRYEQLALDNEVVTFTLSMKVDGGQLEYEVLDGDSTTWGKFGGQGYLRLNTATTLTDLSAYSPDVSVAHSQIGYAANRVERFVLKEVRYYSTEGLLQTDATERVVHELTPEAQ